MEKDIEADQMAQDITTQIKKAVEEQETAYGKALYLFSGTNCFRRKIFKYVGSPKFEFIIMVLIIVSSITLALENPLHDPEGSMHLTLQKIDIITTTLFTIEALCKIVAFGLVFNGPGSYLKNPWDIIDFIIVSISIFSLIAQDVNVKMFKILRLLRVLRPLRMISRNEGLKVAVQALLMAIPAIGNVIFISVLFFFIFAIMGVDNLKGRLHYCYSETGLQPTDISLAETKYDCLNFGGVWRNADLHFDHVAFGMLTLFQISLSVGWNVQMFKGIDARAVNQVPRESSGTHVFMLFYVIFIMVGAFFVLNLFVGAVITTFSKEKEMLGKSFMLTQRQKEWLDMRLLMFRSKPKNLFSDHRSEWRNRCLKIATSKCFEGLIMFCIFLNTLNLTIIWYDQPALVDDVTDYINISFGVIFTIEAVIKITGMGKSYFKNKWNLFDFIIVVGGWIGTVVAYATPLRIGFHMTVLRTFRIFRLARLVRRARSLKIIFATFLIALPALANVGGLLMLLLFLYAILGVQLFAKVKLQDNLNNDANF